MSGPARVVPRAHTREEALALVMDHLAAMARYWARLPGKTLEERLDGVVFSTLVMLDGEAAAVPGFKVVPSPHPDDQAYHASHGENWWPDGLDLGGALHEQWANRDRSRP